MAIKRTRYRPDTLRKREFILTARAKGITYQQIGDYLGWSKQRVHQIFKLYRTSYPRKVKEMLEILRIQPCEVCGKKGKNKVHHIDKNRNHVGVRNLMVLCKKCHGVIHKKKDFKIKTRSIERKYQRILVYPEETI